jgi:hypothetical protein
MLKPLIAAISLVAIATPALADPPSHAPAHGKRAKDARQWDARYPERYYVADRKYEPRRMSHNEAIYRGNDGRYYCRRSDGTTGLIVGALAGGTLGNVIAPGESKLIGSLIGGSLGAILGKELDDGVECR